MNRPVKHILGQISQKSFGQLVIYVIEQHDEVYQKNKGYYSKLAKYANPVQLAKYGIKTYPTFKKDDKLISLQSLKRYEDPLEIISYNRFEGKFLYDEEEQTYRPVRIEVFGTMLMKNIYNKVEKNRIKRAWSNAQKYLLSKDGKEPDLVKG